MTSGVPTAVTCIWQWKREVFLTQNPGLRDQLLDVSLAYNQQRTQHWLETQGGFPPLGSHDEYSFYAERCYPIVEDRRQYFQNLAAGKSPHLGYRLLPFLAEIGLLRSAWTTNFDGLVARAAVLSAVTAIEVGLDTTNRIFRQPRLGELLCVSLHGDYRYDALRNTTAELRELDEVLREELARHLQDVTLIVSGYSGRDQSVMGALSRACSQIGSGRLYWCGFEEDEPSEPVTELLRAARAHGREAYFVPSNGFDDLIERLALHCLDQEILRRALGVRRSFASVETRESPPFNTEAQPVTSVIKSNAFQIECPTEILQFEASGFDTPGAWARLRELTEGKDIVAGPLKGKIIALGLVDQIRDAFGEAIRGTIERTPVDERELSYADSAIISILTQALVRSIATIRSLQTDRNRRIWAPVHFDERRVKENTCRVHRAAVLYLRRYGNEQFLVLKPTIYGVAEDGSELPRDVQKELKRLILTRQYNREFNQELEWWRRKIFEGREQTFEFPVGQASTFRFQAKHTPAYAKVSRAQERQSIRIPRQVEPHLVYAGAEYREPYLLFSDATGTTLPRDFHPIRGIVQNRPYDFSLTLRGISTEVRMGVICPSSDAPRLTHYLAGLHQTRRPDSKEEYLLDYPGFSPAFGLPILIPQPGDPGWVDCPEPSAASNPKDGAEALVQHITSGIRALAGTVSPSSIVIYVPERWRPWESYDLPGERFDLHNYIKAYCVQRGIPTQFLREATLTKPYQCEVIWWLALALYMKGMRTPWVLENLDPETAFVGLGYSIDPGAYRGEHIILGCSHIYSSQGLGLRYRLRKIEDPIIRHRNPFLSRDDARRTGEATRQLFYESMLRLPSRVVIHKRTPFSRDEREGLIEGLSGVDAIDMIEVTIDPALRYVASTISALGQFKEDAFPIRRGTAVVLEGRRALLWVHGTAPSIHPSRRHYYQGKSRIPAPLLITRHHGTAGLSTIAQEILGLSKMNWNTLDLYTKLPATIQSSNAIARIGSLLGRFGPQSYDYRLFV